MKKGVGKVLTRIIWLSIFTALTLNSGHAKIRLSPRVTVSGLSSGGFMANQMHIAYSDLIDGAALLASGPYFCSRANVALALNECMNRPRTIPHGETFLQLAKKFEDLSLIDSISNLKDDRVFILSGKLDKTVMPKVVEENYHFYKAAGVKDNRIKYVSNLAVGHAMPTINFGNSCQTATRSPWMSACNYDAAGVFLEHLFGPLNKATRSVQKNFFQFEQPYAPSMNDKGYAYVPAACQRGESCKLHVSFHGCRQTISLIGETYFKNAGLNEWAESNNIVIVYPQVEVEEWLGNPRGCWDWWGYSGLNFATKDGAQMSSVKQVIDQFLNQTIKLKEME